MAAAFFVAKSSRGSNSELRASAVPRRGGIGLGKPLKNVFESRRGNPDSGVPDGELRKRPTEHGLGGLVAYWRSAEMGSATSTSGA